MRGTKLFGWLGLLLGVSSIVSFIGFSDSAGAASIYDTGVIRYGDTAPITCMNADYTAVTDTIDGVENWVRILSPSNTELDGKPIWQSGQSLSREVAYNAILDRQADGSYSYGLVSYAFGDEMWAVITIQNTVSPAYFREHIGYKRLSVDNAYQVIISCNTNGVKVDVTGVHTVIDLMADADYQYSENNHIVFWSGTIDYPSGYEGLEIPNGETKENLYPNFTYLVTDKQIKATQDLSQQLPDLPEPDESWQNNEWQVMWYLFKCETIDTNNMDCDDRETIHSELLNRDEEYSWQVDDYGDYLLIAEFRYQSCYRYASWPVTPDNCILISDHDEYNFVPGRTVYLEIDGNNIVGDTGNLNCDVAGYCYDDTRFKDCNVVTAIATLSFDDFNYADCLENISLLGNMLSFDTIRFSNSWVSTGNCYTLGTLGNWLNLENKYVCPHFSNEVRNTVTPFITFMLGLVMVRFIAMKGSHGEKEDI